MCADELHADELRGEELRAELRADELRGELRTGAKKRYQLAGLKGRRGASSASSAWHDVKLATRATQQMRMLDSPLWPVATSATPDASATVHTRMW